MKTQETYGKVIAGAGTDEEKTMDITGYVMMEYKDKRVVKTLSISDGTYYVSVENPIESGRLPITEMRLSKESFIGILATSLSLLAGEGVDMDEELRKAIKSTETGVQCSRNLIEGIKKLGSR